MIRRNFQKKLQKGLKNSLIELPYSFIVDSKELMNDADKKWFLEPPNNLPEDIIYSKRPLSQSDNISFYPHPDFTFDRPFVALVNDCWIPSSYPYPVALDNKRRIISDTIKFDINEVRESLVDKFLQSPISLSSNLLISNGDYEQEFELASIVSFKGNYYLDVIEHTPKIRGIKKYEERTGKCVDIILPPDTPDYAIDILQNLDIDSKKIHIWNGCDVHIENLVVPSFPEPSKDTIDWLRTKLGGKSASRTANMGTYNDFVYISRQKASKGRRITNFDELLPVLKDYNVEIVHCEDHSLKEQIEMFAQVECVIGPHGAGLTNIIWGDDLYVVEIFNSVVQPPFYVISEILNYDYQAVQGEPDSNSSIYKRHEDMKVDQYEVEKILSNISKESNRGKNDK